MKSDWGHNIQQKFNQYSLNYIQDDTIFCDVKDSP